MALFIQENSIFALWFTLAWRLTVFCLFGLEASVEKIGEKIKTEIFKSFLGSLSCNTVLVKETTGFQMQGREA
jgi:hypothetical protein